MTGVKRRAERRAQCRRHRQESSRVAPGETALGWSAAAMGDAARELGETRYLDLPQAVAVVSEAVWWVTMVHATVLRHHANAYDRVLTGLDPSWWRAAEETLGGFWFVRNCMGYHADPADFVRPRQAQAAGTWRSRSGRGSRCPPWRPGLPRSLGRGR